ncbi:uncharacterized protein LOC135159857 [Diachasmimorpha longicaudata]|uniref:uncharacterized protein LOC135159857 n=1 Tax=Diachasmimorpha longicaudata TaxID=58733 RepID=UPI0030B8A53A
MGRKALVSNEEIIPVLRKYMSYFKTNNFPSSSDKVWIEISHVFGGRWQPHTVYTHVTENKRNNLAAARNLEGVLTSPPTKATVKQDVSVSETINFNSSVSEEEFSFENERLQPTLEDFHLLLTDSDWNLIKPDDTSKSKQRRLRPRAWANVISNAFWRRYGMRCAMIAKWSNVIIGRDGSFSIKFKAICKSEKCGNIFIGSAVNYSGVGKLDLNIRARDTRQDLHEDVQRPLNGVERAQVGEQLLRRKPGNYREELLRSDMAFGESVPPTIRRGHIYRQAKMEAVNKQNGILVGDKRDQLTIIRDMCADPKYSHIILDVGLSPFHLIYATPEQAYVYKEYCRVVKDSKIMSDATGTVVKKFEKAPGVLTGHIFFYTLTINFEKKTIPVFQLLTERQDTDFLIFWLSRWVRLYKISAPRQAISDQERALMLAHCRVFNGVTIKQYVDNIFLWALNDIAKERNPFPAPTVIRIDVAHFMAAAAKWNCFHDRHKFRLKRFYVRAIALLVDCMSVREFQLVFLLTCFIALTPVTDHIVPFPDFATLPNRHILDVGYSTMSVEEARTFLGELISVRGPVIDNLHNQSETEQETISNFEELSEEDNCKSKYTVVHQWIKDLISLVKPENPEFIPGNVENGLYFPPIVTELERIGKEFPLWSSAALPSAIIPCHATTASQEGYFKEIKNRIFEGTILPCTCHRFLRGHLDHISSGEREMGSILTRFVHTKNKEVFQGEPRNCQQDEDKENNNSPSDSNKASLGYSDCQKNSQIFRQDEPAKFQQDDDNGNITSNPDLRKSPLNDSDFQAKMEWRGIINNEKKPLWQLTTTNVEDCATESTEQELNTNDICSDILELQSDDLFGLIKDDLLNVGQDDNNNKQSSKDENQKCKGGVHVETDSSISLLKSPKFSSTLTDDSAPLASYHASPVLRDNSNVNGNEHPNIKKQYGKAPKTRKATGYFAPYPQIKILNENVTILRTGNFLPNGFHSPVIRFNGMGIMVQETCGFDSFVHILQYAALDDTNYRKILESSTNGLSVFTINFLKEGLTKSNLLRRFNLLSKFYSLRQAKRATTLDPYILNVKDTLTNIWRYFYTDPVAHRRASCDNKACSYERTRPLYDLAVDHNVIRINGFKEGMKSAIEISRWSKCKRAGCNGNIHEQLDCGHTVFVELDVRDFTRYSNGKGPRQLQCKLADLPDELNLGQMYRLIGVIDFEAHWTHFVAYCRRLSISWLQCDDMKLESAPWKADATITPVGIFLKRAMLIHLHGI